MEEACRNFAEEPTTMMMTLKRFWNDEQGQDIAEYAVMLAVILVIVIGTVRLIGTNATTVFSQVASSVG
jgi:Flp pilus assembly pilin Flp